MVTSANDLLEHVIDNLAEDIGLYDAIFESDLYAEILGIYEDQSVDISDLNLGINEVTIRKIMTNNEIVDKIDNNELEYILDAIEVSPFFIKLEELQENGELLIDLSDSESRQSYEELLMSKRNDICRELIIHIDQGYILSRAEDNAEDWAESDEVYERLQEQKDDML